MALLSAVQLKQMSGNGPAEDALTLSSAQQRLWFLAQMAGISDAHHISWGLHIFGELDFHVLKRALDRLVERHQILRASFKSVDGQPWQSVAAPDCGFELREHKLSAGGEAEIELERIRRHEAGRGFDLEHGPLIRGRLVHLAAQEHVLFISMHNLVSDIWSAGIVTNELSALYKAYSAGEDDPLPEPVMQYADYALWEQQQLSGGGMQRERDYWRSALEGAPLLLELPVDRPRQAEQVSACDVVDLQLNATLTRKLKALGRRHAMTLDMLMLAAWSVVLSRLSGQKELVIGVASSNRTRPGTRGLIGPFANKLALRIETSGAVAGLLERVKSRMLEARDHQDLPFEQVVEMVKPPRSIARAPIFQTMLVWQEQQKQLSISGLKVVSEQTRCGVSEFDLELALGESGDRIVGGLKYVTALFDRGTIEWHAGYLRKALAAMVADESLEIDRIPLLSDVERVFLLELGNGASGVKSMMTPEGVCLYGLISAQAERSPHVAAVIEPGREITYRQLVQRANGLGRKLKELGVGPETRVALLADRSAESVIGVLGILAADGAYVPLDPSFPEERIAFILNDASVPVLLAPAVLAEQARAAIQRAGIAARIVVIADAPTAELPLDQEVTPANAAYVIYTSGSTGTPKGVVVEHSGAVNLVRGFAARHDFGGHRLLMIPPLVFDASVGDVFPALAAGGTLVLHPAPAELGWMELEQFCREFRITAIDAPAALWRRWTDGFASYQGNDILLPDVTLLMIGGENVPLEQVRLFARLTESRVLLANHYGPTEASVCATMLITQDGSELDGQDFPIGRPLPGIRVYVLDEHLQLTPRGATGELCIGGAGVAREYLNCPELTGTAFIHDPFSPGGKARMYRTGDLVRWNAGGTLQFIGRRDHQVKLRGLRVELGEIEACLAGHPGVREAVVLAREDHPGNKLLAAYITTVAGNGFGAEIDIEALRTHLSSQLPAHMVPAAYVLMKEFPLNANGKLDRKKLPVPDTDAYLAREYEAPLGEIESTVASIWAGVLKVERVGRNDNFFELGGHSLLAITAIERMREAGYTVDVRDLFASPTLKGLAEAAGKESRGIAVPPNLIPEGCAKITPEMLPLINLSQGEIEKIVDSVPGGAANVQDIYPLAPLQEGILFHHLLETEGDVYLTTRLLTVESRQHLDRYLAALQTVIDRHDILRTGIAWKGLPEPVQVVWRHAPLSAEEVNLDPAKGDIAEQLCARFNTRHYRLDVRHAPLFRLAIAEDPAHKRWLILELMHHLIGDQMTSQVMQQETQAIVQGDAERLPVPTLFRDFVVQARQGVSREEHETFFARMLKDVDEPTAPFGLTDVQGDGSRIVEMRHEIDSGLSRQLRAEARRLGVTLASLCHVAWALVLACVSGRDDVVFGTVMFGRMQSSEGSDRGLGLFINTLPVRIRVGDEGVASSVRKTHELLTQLLRHEHASLGLAQRCSSVRPPVPLFTSLLNYRHVGAANAMTERDAARLQSEDNNDRTSLKVKVLGEWERTNFPFGLYLNDMGQDLSIDVQVDNSIRPQRVCALMETALTVLVEALQNTPERTLASLSVLPEEERQQVLYRWNATEAEYPQEKCLHELFEEQVEKTPDATALVFENESLSYIELNRRANCLAHCLREMGVKADERVGICAERGIEMVVALFAVLKAGGAYVPLDPDYPEERLQYMLKNSSPVVVLTQGYLLERMKATSAASVQRQPVIDITVASLLWQEQAAANLDRTQTGLTSDHLAYVIYTSGSTGTPKGAMIEHKSIVNRLIWMQSAYELKADDAVLQKTPFSFDVSVWEFFWPLLTGARLVMARPGGHKDPGYLCEMIAKNRITTLHFVPSMLHAFLEYGDAKSCSSIKNIVCSGEALSPSLARRCRELLPGAELHNLYGPTEAAVDVTAWTYPAQAAPPATIPIGRPIANTQMYILDSKTQPVPAGVAGELYIGGVQVGRGYLNRDELTAERFVKDPFAQQAGARMYRTGDLGRWLDDGNIEYLGRNDFQVKVRGFRIELGEIESRLLEHDAVREAVVVARKDRTGEQQLVAYYVGHDQAKPDVEQLRHHLAATLPEYMVPAAYVSLEKFPLTSSGKLDRKALPSADSSAYVTRGYEAPVGEVENSVASIWADVLKLERVGRNDNFFELGGHSLLAVTVIERMREAGLALDVRALFASPTLKGLAEAAGGESRAIAVPPNLIPAGSTQITPAMLPLVALSQSDIEKIVASVPGGAANVQDIYPLAPLQEGILFHHRLTKEGDVYLTGTLLAIESREDLERHVQAVQTVIDRHDILRTAIVWEGLPEPVQVVWRKAQIKVEHVTLDPAAGDIAQQLLARFSPRHYRLDVRQAPLWRLFIAEDAPNHRWVILDLMHHMVVDHVTLEILQQEIQAIAQGKAEGLLQPLPFRNFVAQTRLGISREEHETFFTRMLGDVDEPTAPYGLTNVQGDGSGTKEAHRTVDAELFERLRTQARTMGVSVASMCHLAWALVLARTSGRDDVAFGTVMFGRMQAGEGSDRALGIFINTLPLRIRLENDNVQASVHNTHALLTQLLRHEHASLGLAQRCSSLRPPAPLFTSILNYRHTLAEGRDSETGMKSGETWAGWKVLGVEDRNNYPFALSINDFGEGLSFDVKVDGSIEPQQVCDLMHTALESLTKTLESDPAALVKRLDVLPSAVREQLVIGWNLTKTEYPENTCIHLQFEKQVERTPELRAVASQGQGLSYQELNRRANQLGHYLRNLGVGPDIRVGICMKRSVEMIVAVLAIMKAGGAYVPLDPAYPEERLRYMMEDAGILIVVTQKEVEAALRSSGIWLVCVDEEEERARIAQENEQNPEAITAIENLAYVIYTSGSTGKSKGVGIEHRQLANYVNGIMRDLKRSGLKEGAKYATVSTLSADLGNTVIYPSLGSGGELHVINEDHVMDGQLLGEYFEREQIDCLKIVPSHLQGLRGAKGGEKVMPRKLLVVGGEASTWQWAKDWTTTSECAVMNHYGPTETTVGVLRYPIQQAPPEQARETVPIGQPLGNVQAYVVNQEMEPVPIGVGGELYIGGAGVGRGYVNRPDLTAERFVPDPFSGFGQRLYKTGDLVRRNKDGNIEFLGRVDHQVKIRGFRIELGEIESALRQQPGIEHAVVVVAESENDNKRLVAYVTASGSGQDGSGVGAIDIEALRTQLGLLLPDYMVPAAYVVLDQLPLTANGKLDRKALPSPDSGAYVTRDYEAPVGEVETTLARIWAEVLKLDRVGRNDNFFELGGHSLLAITVIERMREAGLILEVGALFDFPILKGLAENVGGEDRTVQAPPNLIPARCTAITPPMLPLISLSQREIDKIVAAVPGGAANVQDIYPLAPLQEGILFHHLLTSEGDIYLNQTVLGGSRERLDRYIKALQVVIDRHDILRTAVAWQGLPEPVQVVWRHAPLSVEEISLDPAEGDVAEQLRARFNPEHYRLDVRQAPLWRLIIAQDVPNNRWVMLELAHHLVADNTSIRFLLREIEMILQGQAELLPTPLPFRNFVAQARLGVSRQEHEEFFTRMLGDVDEPTAPFGLTNVQGDVSHIQQGYRTVDPEVCRRLRAQARALGVTAASLCHLAWALVLARTSGRDDVVFGTVMFGRMQGGEGSDRVMGIFINTLPLRIKIGDEDVRTSVRKTHELQTQLLRHEHASLALVQRCSSVAAPSPLFTSILNYRHLREEAISAEKGAEAMVDLKYLGGQERNNYPFALAINDLGEAMTLDVKVDDSIDPQQVCAWMHTALESLVEALEFAPDTAVRTLEVLPAAEKEQLVHSWNQSQIDYAQAETIHGLFEEQAERTPELRAVVSQKQALSYLELNQRANQLAHYLRKQGVRPDDRVGIFMKRDVEMVVGLLAILKAGGAYVGLDTTYPAERLHYMIEDAEARIVLTQQKLAERLRGSPAQLVCLDEPGEMASIARQSRQNPEPAATLENLVYVIYTSGSTGKPKGVGIEHRQLVNYVRGITRDLEELGVGVGAKYATVSTLSADLGNTAIYPSLLSGGELHVIDEDHVMDGQRLGEYFEREKIDCLKIVPSHLEGLRGARGGERVMPRKVLVSGGEALPWKWARDWQTVNACKVINHYGPTETTVGAVRFRIPPGETGDGIVPIGQPLGNMQLYVMDRHMELVPSGGLGELYIGGAGVGRGYVNRPELTAERFVPDPFSGFGQRLYKTGDLVRRNKDGNIEFLGRVDQQIKIRGFRIELGEIESALRQQPGIEQAAVVATEGENGSKRLVAYIVPSSSPENSAVSVAIDVELLRAQLGSLLPDYMVPAAYVLMKEFPLNANGKLDRKKLPAPDTGAYLAREFEAPVGEIESTVASIWANVLKVERAGRNDNFFELGGHSLLAITAIERMREAGYTVNVRDLFASPTLKSLAEAAGKESRGIAVPPNLIPEGCEKITPEMLPLIKLSQDEIEKIVDSVPGGAANMQDIYPLAPLQEGILFHHLLETEGDVYLSATLLAAANRERLDRYVAALQIVVDRHDILRTAIVWEGLPEPVQVVWRHAPLIVEEVNLDPAKGDIAEQLRASFDPRHNRLDIRQAPMWRLYIARDLPNQRWVILELKHHLTGDNTTARFLLNEVRTILHGQAKSLPEPLPFRNFVAQARLGVSREEHEAFFTRMLKDVDEPTVPFGLANVQGDGSRIVEASRNVDQELTVKLRASARALGVTVASMCHLAWAMVLARTSGRDDVVFGTVLFGRMQGGEGADRGLGIFINTLPVRIRIGNEGVAASVRKTHQLLTELFRYEHASLALVQRCSSVQAPAPLFTSLLNYRHVREEAASTETAQKMANLDFIESGGRTNYPFGVYINDLGQDLSIEVQVEPSIAPQRVCALMHTALESLVKALEDAPESPVETLPVLPEEERQQVLYTWNATDTEYPKDKFLHELFEEQVERTPQATAVVLENQSLTYDQLNQHANRLAHYLRTLGVKPDGRVGICVERGIDTIVALVAVLKAGGAYVPLDPGYPAERLRFMLQDSAPMALLTHYHLRELFVDIASDIPIVDLNGDGEEWSDQPATNPHRSDAGLRVENLAYVIYTSGSTGMPKGVALEHRNAVNYVCWARQKLAAGALQQSLFSTSLNFDLAVFECFAPLTTGGTIRIVANVLELENRPLDVTLVATVPSAMRALVESNHVPSTVREVVLGGELLKKSLVEKIFATTQVENVCNIYGPTETTTNSTWMETKRGEAYGQHIGRPVANTQVYILDRRMEPVPIGVVGEIYIAGTGVTRGYLNRPQLTAERFLKDPFARKPEARMYRTGDLGRWLEDGNIEYRGRNDFQVKVRGVRIELGEIEALLLEHTGVREAIVMAREDKHGEQHLVAYYTLSPGAAPDPEELRKHLAEKLTEHMVPRVYVSLDRLPLTASGKLDRKALPAPEVEAYESRAYEPPQGETEATLAAIWVEILKLERVSRNDNFFDSGGHSLLAIQLGNRIRATLGVVLELRDIFAANTLKDMATVLNALMGVQDLLPDSGQAGVAHSSEGRYL